MWKAASLSLLVACSHAPPPTSRPTPPARLPTAITITHAGVGALGRYEWWKHDEEENARLIQQALAALTGATVRFDVLDVPGEVETEEGYWSVRRGELELAQVFRQTGPDGDLPAAVVVWTPEISTADGTRVGDALGALAKTRDDLTCEEVSDGRVAQFVAADLQCRSAHEPRIVYVLDAQAAQVDDGKVQLAAIAAVKIVAIAHEPDGS